MNVTLNMQEKIPWRARFYGLTWILILLLIVTFIFSIFGGGSEAFRFLGSILFFVGIWLLLDYACVSFIVGTSALTINSGILIKHSKSIPFSTVQDISTSRGPLASLFKVSRINIWTGSPDQIQIQNGRSNNRPSGSLLIRRADAEWMKEYILGNRQLDEPS